MSQTDAPDPQEAEENTAQIETEARPEGEAEISEITQNQDSTYDETPLPADEIDEEQPELLDIELAQVISTPAGMKGALEAVLFTSPEALTLRRLCNVLFTKDKNLVEASLRQLQNELDTQRRGIRLLEGAEGWRLVTREMFGELILRLRGKKRRPPMSPAALETLAIVAYRPGIIRAEIEAIRGVESSGTLRNLIDMGMIEITGRRDVLGRPPLYGTTQAFLEAFGLKTLEELPQITDLKAEFIKNIKAAEDREIEETKARPHSPDPEQQAAEAALAAAAAAEATAETAPDDTLDADELADEAAEEKNVGEDTVQQEAGEELSEEEAEEALDAETEDDSADEDEAQDDDEDELDAEALDQADEDLDSDEDEDEDEDGPAEAEAADEDDLDDDDLDDDDEDDDDLDDEDLDADDLDEDDSDADDEPDSEK